MLYLNKHGQRILLEDLSKQISIDSFNKIRRSLLLFFMYSNQKHMKTLIFIFKIKIMELDFLKLYSNICNFSHFRKSQLSIFKFGFKEYDILLFKSSQHICTFLLVVCNKMIFCTQLYRSCYCLTLLNTKVKKNTKYC